jgi:hypothetical protein
VDRIYCDSNIFRIIKPSHPYYKDELCRCLNDVKDKFLFIFSEAHLDDLSHSEESFRNEDLGFMEKYVRDNYFTSNHVKNKEFETFLLTPVKAYATKDYAAAKRALRNPFDIDSLFEGLGDSPELKLAGDLMKAAFDLPVASLGNTIDTSDMDEKQKALFDKIMPGYTPSMSIKDFMRSISPYSAALLQDEKEVSSLRKYIAEYMNRDEYSFEKWGLAFNERMKETVIGKSYLEMVDGLLLDRQKNDFYLCFSYAYANLEMFNITQEQKSSGGLKKFDFESLNTDGLHAYYGSFCDYLVTDDKGLQVKANIVYQLFGFRTKVLSSVDFINMRSILMGQEEDFKKFVQSLSYDLKHSFQINSGTNIKSGDKVSNFKTTHPYFNFFNRMKIIQDKSNITVALFCERGALHGNFYLYREIELLVNKMLVSFGPDDKNKGVYDLTENNNLTDGYSIREWIKGEMFFSLRCSHERSRGHFIALAVDMPVV